ncbi:MAG TPA: VOC family protein [Geminicoccaceae bacterium]|nr:VOC family protein [Geminicoccus sp.]HMU48275.1 VOC family protein [Geminicoccaceae bacterium]
MVPPVTGLDHLIVGVRDLAAARAQWARLGFNSTPRGRHVGWGTANHCLMLAEGYVELLGIVDPAGFDNGLGRLLEQREGLLGLALGTGDPEGIHAAWSRNGLDPEPPRRLTRMLELPEGEVELAFRNVMPGRQATAGVNLFACGHLTPQLLRRPAWTAHPNGALALVGCTIVASDPAAVAGAMARVFGSSALTRTDEVTAVQTGTAVLLVADEGDAGQLHPGFEFQLRDEAARPMVMAIMVDDPDRAASFLKLQGIPHRRDSSGAVLVQPEHATGVCLELVPG